MKDYVEQLPLEINGHYLRIKARSTEKTKWCVRYIRKVDRNKDKPLYGWKYRTEIQAWGRTLEIASKKMLKKIDKVFPHINSSQNGNTTDNKE